MQDRTKAVVAQRLPMRALLVSPLHRERGPKVLRAKVPAASKGERDRATPASARGGE